MESKGTLIGEELRIQRLHEATALFEAGEYGKCVHTLETVKSDAVEEECDLRLQHNLVIARFCAGGAREPGALLESLSDIALCSEAAAEEAARKEEAAKAKAISFSTGVQTVDEASRAGPRDSPDTSRKAKESGKESQLSVADALSILAEDTDTIVSNALVQYNIALVDFSLKHFASALQRLEKVFTAVTRLPEYLVCNICFLLLDTHLALAEQHPEHRALVLQRTGDVLAHLDKAFPNLLKKTTLKKGSKEARSTISFPTGRKPADPVSFKYLHHIYRAKIYLCSKSTKQAKREIKWCMSVGNQNPTSMFLKSNLEYQGKNFSKSIKLLNAFHGTDLDTSLPALYYNNLGCIHYGMGKASAAEHYFYRAVVENEGIYRTPPDVSARQSAAGHKKNRGKDRHKENQSSGQCEREVNLGRFARDRKASILYNNGLLQLRSRNAQLAFECFLGAMPLYSKNPWLWLRLAECCIVEHVEMMEKESKEHGNAVLVGEGNERLVLLPSSGASDSSSVRGGAAGGAGDAVESNGIFREGLGLKGNPFGVMSLTYAEICLSTFVRLLDESAAADGAKGNPSARQHKLRLCALANLCFVTLACGCPHKTLNWAGKVFALSPPLDDDAFVALVYMYAAEAQCLLNRTEAAMATLEVLLKEDAQKVMSVPINGAGKPSEESLRYALLHNLAVCSAIMGAMQTARSHLASALLICPTGQIGRAHV